MSEQKILRITEFLWRFWWFCFYIILLPVLCAVVGYYVVPLLMVVPRASIYGAAITGIGALAIFSRFFQKYRKLPPFQDNTRVFNARIYEPFFLLILTAVVKPIEAAIYPLPYVSDVLATIPLSMIFTFLWIYFYSTFFQWDEKAKYTPLYSHVNQKISKSTYEIVYFCIYLVEILFLNLLGNIQNIWYHLIILPAAFFGLIWIFTISERRLLGDTLTKNAIALGNPVGRRQKKTIMTPELTTVNIGEFDDAMQGYLRKVTKLASSLIFLVLLQLLFEFNWINLAEIKANPNLGAIYALLFCLISVGFIKMQVDLALKYKIKRFWALSTAPKIRLLQNFNLILAAAIPLLIVGWSIAASMQYLAIGLLFAWTLVVYMESRANFYGKLNSYAQFAAWSIIGIEICWGLIPVDWIFFVFLAYMYLVFEIFKRLGVFYKKSITVVQNVIVTGLIFAILYGIYPPIIESYLFSSDPNLQLISHGLFVTFFCLIAIIAVLYRLYFSQFHRQTSRALRIALSASTFLFLCFLAVIISFRLTPILDANTIWTAIYASACLIPIFFAAFSSLHFKFGIISQEGRQSHLYYSYWILSIILVLVITMMTPTIGGILGDALYFLIALQSIIQVGVRYNKVSEEFRQKLSRVASNLIIFILLAFFCDLFINVIQLDVFFSVFLAMGIISCISHLFSLGHLTTGKLRHYLTTITLYFLTLMVFLDSLNWYVGTLNIYVVPPLLACIAFVWPNLYAWKILKDERGIYRGILTINIQVMAILLSVLQVPALLNQILLGESTSVLAMLIPPFFYYALIILLFSSLGMKVGLISKEELSRNCFYAAWPLLPCILILLLSSFPGLNGISWSVLTGTLDLQIMIYWTRQRKNLGQGFYTKFTSINSIAFVIGVFWVIYGAFSNLLWTSLLAVFLGLCGVCAAALAFTKFFALYPPKYVKVLASFTLYFLVAVVLYYSILGFGGGTFYIAMPLLLTAIISFIPHSVTYKLGLLKRGVFLRLANLSLLAIAIGLGMISLVSILTVTTLSAALLLLYSLTLPLVTFCIAILLLSSLGKRVGLFTKVECNYNQYYATWSLIPPICLLIIAVWPLSLGYYMGYVVGILFLTISLHFMFQWSVSLKKLSHTRAPRLILLDSIVFASTIISIPTIIGLDLLRLGLSFPTFEVLCYTSFILLTFAHLFQSSSASLLLVFGANIIDSMKRVQVFVWLYVKVMLCLTLAFILPFTSVLEGACKILILGAMLTPITLKYLKRAGWEARKQRVLIDQLIMVIYSVALMALYANSFWPSMNSFPRFGSDLAMGIIFGGVNVFLFLNWCIVAYRRFTTKFQPQLTNDELPEHDSPGRKWGAFFSISMILFLVIFFQGPGINLIFLGIMLIITLSNRNSNPILRVLQVFLLSYLTFLHGMLLTDLLITQHTNLWYDLWYNFAVILQQGYSIMAMNLLYYFISLLIVLGFSIVLNRKNMFESLASFISISTIIFLSLSSFTTILFSNVVTITWLVFLLQLTPYLYYYKYPVAKLIGKVCVVLLVFICIQYMSYQVWFLPADFGTVKGTLALTFTASVTAFAFVMVFNKLPEKVRRYCYVTALSTIIISLPIFAYFALFEAMPALESSILQVISLDIGIVLFFLSTGIYQWRFSRAIWDAVWWAWLLLPLVNYVIIAQSLQGIDVVMNALNFFGTLGLPGSIILSVIFCTLMYMPIFYTKIRAHFGKILLFIWGESLFLVGWIAQNLFGQNILLSSGFFGIVAIFLLIPVLYLLKAWKVLAYFWLGLTAFNVFFIHSYLSFLGLPFENILSIDMIVVGLLSLTYSFFPNLRHRHPIAIVAYSILLTGVFFLIYFVIMAITLNPYTSVNLSFIILAFTLFSSKYLKLDQKNVHFVIAIILISNISLLVLFSLIIIPGLELFAVFLFLAVFGGSFYVFNYLEMIKRIDSRIPWGIMAAGCALAVSDLCLILWNANSMFLGFICSFILLLFLYRYLHQYRYVLWIAYPIPFAFFIQAFFVLILGPFLIFGWVATYIIFFQIIFNIFHKLVGSGFISLDHHYLEILAKQDIQKAVNSTCFLVNSLSIAVWVTLASPVSWINQIFEFLLLWSFLTIMSLKYMKSSRINNIKEGFFRISQDITILLYIIVPLTLSFNLIDYFLLIGFQPSDLIVLIGLIFSGILFVEVYVIDRLIVVNMLPRMRNQLIFLSWFVLGNFFCVQVYLLYGNVFFLCLMVSILNLPSSHFLKPFNISEKLRTSLQFALLNSITAEISLYLASVLTGIEQTTIPLALGTPSIIFFLLSFSLLYLGFNIAIRGYVRGKFFQQFNLALFTGFQVLFASYYLFLAAIFNAINLPVVIFLVFSETFFTIFLVNLWSKCLPQEKQEPTRISGNRVLKFLLTLEIPVLCFGLLYGSVGIYENLLISQFCLFLISSIESEFMLPPNKKYALLFYAFSVYALSITLFVYLSTFFNIFGIHYSLVILLFLFTQLYATRILNQLLKVLHLPDDPQVVGDFRIASSESLDNFELTRTRIERGLYYVLMNAIFLVSALYLSALVSLIIPSTLLGTIPPLLISAGIFCLIEFLYTAVLNRWLPARFRIILLTGLFIGFQLWVAMIWTWGIDMLSTGTPTSLNLLVILETVMLFFPFYAIDKFRSQGGSELEIPAPDVPEEEKNDPTHRRTAALTFVLYCELSVFVFNASLMAVPILESVLLATLALFLLSAIELTTIQKIDRRFIRILHALSYIALSVLWCGFLLQFSIIYPVILGLSIFSLIVMQFYTNIAIFNARVRYHPQDLERLTASKNKVQTIIGLCFYGGILFFLQQAISAFNVSLQGLALCLGTFLLMILDRARLKFTVENVSRSIQAVAYVGSLVFLHGLVLLLIMKVYTIWPLVFLFDYAGIIYLVKILEFLESVKNAKEKVFQSLIIATYLTLTAWPFFFATLDWITNFILCCVSTGVLLVLTYADDQAGAIPQRIRIILRKTCFFVIGGILAGGITLLISPIIDLLFVTFGSALNVCLFLLFFMGILALFLRPFQKHSAQAITFWYGIFTLGGLVLYFISTSLLAAIIFISGFLLVYWVIFVPAVRQFLIKQIRALYAQVVALAVAIKNALVQAYQKMVAFWHLHFQGIWTIIWAALGMAAFWSVWFFFSVPITSAIPVGLLIFVMGLFGIIARRGSEEAGGITFQKEFLYYASLYFTTTWALFSFFPWNIFLVLGSVLLFGGVLLFFVDRAWKQERLSAKWRFIAIASFVALFFVTGGLLAVQLSGGFNFI